MKRILLFSSLLFIGTVLHAQIEKTILCFAGRLSYSLTMSEKESIVSLTINGLMDARDFKTIRDSLPSLVELDLKNVIIVAYNGEDGTNYHTKYNANELPDFAFFNKNKLEKVILPSSLLSFGESVFLYCTGLTSIEIPPFATSIGSSAFSRCTKLESVFMSPFLTTIKDYAFYHCTSLSRISIPFSVTSIGESAFWYCTSLSEIYISSNVRSIEKYAFGRCPAYIHVDDNNPYYSSIDGVLYNKNQSELIQCPISKAGDFIIPSTVTRIIESAIYQCGKLKRISIPSSVEIIESFNFHYCNSLVSVNVDWHIPFDLHSALKLFKESNITNCKLTVPYGTYRRYKNDYIWKDFGSINERDGFFVGCDSVNLTVFDKSCKSIPIFANVPWEVVSDQSWLTVYPAFGFGDDTLFIQANGYNEGERRYGTVTVKSSGQADHCINVTQFSGLEVAPLSVVLNANAGSGTKININSVVSWTALSNQPWLKVIPYSNSHNNNVLLIADENFGEIRNAVVTIKSNNLTDRIVNVKQTGFYKNNILIKHINDPVEIDGFRDEIWDIVSEEPIRIDFNSERATIGYSFWRALYDETYFYCMIGCNDDDHWPAWESGGNFLDFDGIELFWDVNEVLKDGIGAAVSNSGHYHFSPKFIEGYYDTPITINQPEPGNENPGGTYAFSLSGEGYSIEMAIPWKSFLDRNGNYTGPEILSSRAIGFDIKIVDQDEGYTYSPQRKSWHNTGEIDECTNNMDVAGIIYLDNAVNNYKSRPISNAGSDQTIFENEQFTLNGSFFSEADPDEIMYLWISPDNISLNNEYSATPDFIAPKITNDTSLLFKLIVYDGIAYSEMDSVIVTIRKNSIPDTLSLSEENMVYGSDECFNALSEITVAGNGTTIDFENGSSSLLIAGQSIIFLPGFHAHEGSFMHSYITLTGSFCEDIPNPYLVHCDTKSENYLNQRTEMNSEMEKYVKVYPNPGDEYLIVEQHNFEVNSKITIYNIVGSKILTINDIKPLTEISVCNLNRGIYFLYITDSKHVACKKIQIY
ncbi:MAG TPA: leucine-rich repeat protein [Prolixibacteraceae bacterium]|nr:leucine-rich repeat protein [Prolixibacteraceae bacterium]